MEHRESLQVLTVKEYVAKGERPDLLFWVGCAGSFDQRAREITKAMVKILHHAGISFAILGKEESCTGDPAKRAGNEYLFQMQALQNIELLNTYQVQRIVTTCPHCFNTLKNEYPALGGNYQVFHHTELINTLLEEGKISVEGGAFKGQRIAYHDSCYLGRANGIYQIPRAILRQLDVELVELKRCKSNGLCCGAGGAQIFTDAQKGTQEINIARAQEVKQASVELLATACPFCSTMLGDGLRDTGAKGQVKDIAELVANSL